MQADKYTFESSIYRNNQCLLSYITLKAKERFIVIACQEFHWAFSVLFIIPSGSFLGQHSQEPDPRP